MVALTHTSVNASLKIALPSSELHSKDQSIMDILGVVTSVRFSKESISILSLLSYLKATQCLVGRGRR